MRIKEILVEGGVDCSLVGMCTKKHISWRDGRLIQ